ncbi:MAG: pyridoxine 5'-phosphate synthase [Acidobacteriota bacterium]
MTRLAVNIDHIATIREARRAIEPDPVLAAQLAELAGAQGITVHLRQDRRHIKERDIDILRRTITTKLNVEMAATKEMIQIAARSHIDQATLVPERPEELTTEGGLDVIKNSRAIKKAIQTLESEGIDVSVFVDPDLGQIQKASDLGARLIEINTGLYASEAPRAFDHTRATTALELEKILAAVDYASKLQLRILAGHGLTYRNVRPISAIPGIEELNIGHNIVARAALVGIERAVREMIAAMNE